MDSRQSKGSLVADEHGTCRMDSVRLAYIERAIHDILSAIGEDVSREGLSRTPLRVARALSELTSGYQESPDDLINDAYYHAESNDIVAVLDIGFCSLCEHHLMPFVGKVHVAYVPSDKVIGMSKIPRIVDMYARRLQMQERMTRQIAELLMEKLKPRGVAVVVDGFHLCAAMRGIKNASARLVTSIFLGVFREDETLRREFYALIQQDKG